MYCKIRCYIVSSDDEKKIKIEINDEDSLLKINNIIKYIQKEKKYKVPIDKECNNRFIIIINNNTDYKFKNINYDNLSDLCGLEVFMTFYYKYYYFKITKNEDGKKKDYHYSGYNFIASKINNIKIFND